MVYSNKFVMCVLVNGRPQKELANGQVSLPFGSEYALRFRNKNDRRAVVEIWIDGENVSGSGYVVNAHSYVDIQRHHDIDRSFKFVSLDSEDAVDHGKNGPNHDKVKGTIEAKFRLETETPPVIYRDVHHDHHHHHDHYHPRPRPYPYHPPRPIWLTSSNDNSGQSTYGGGTISKGGTIRCSAKGISSGGGQTMDSMLSADAGSVADELHGLRARAFCNSAISPPVEKELKDGCTVEGHSTGQRFRQIHIDLEDAETCLKLFLVGFEEQEVVATAKKKKRKTVKDDKITDLERENLRLQQELENLQSEEEAEAEEEKALAENQRLKEELAAKKKKKKAKGQAKKTTRSKKSTTRTGR